MGDRSPLLFRHSSPLTLMVLGVAIYFLYLYIWIFPRGSSGGFPAARPVGLLLHSTKKQKMNTFFLNSPSLPTTVSSTNYFAMVQGLRFGAPTTSGTILTFIRALTLTFPMVVGRGVRVTRTPTGTGRLVPSGRGTRRPGHPLLACFEDEPSPTSAKATTGTADLPASR